MNYEEALTHKVTLTAQASDFTREHFNFVIVPAKFEDRIRYLAHYENNGITYDDECIAFTNFDDYVVYGLATDFHRDYMMNK